jgi:CRP/FNR family transcriptional regulator
MECLCEKLTGEEMPLAPVCIGHLWMFRDLRPEELEALGSEAVRRRHRKGDTLFRQGEDARELFLIKGGRVRLVKLLEDGTETTLDIRKAGDFIGENVLGEAVVLPFSAVCMEDTLTCGFSRDQFQDLVLAFPNVGLQVIRNMSERIVWLTEQVGSMAFTSVEERLYRVLANIAREHGRPTERGLTISFPLTHEDMGFLVGAHRVSVTRALAKLKREGRLEASGRELTLPHPLNGPDPLAT